MRTLLSQFCESFDRIVRPVMDPLDGAAQALSEASPEMPGREVRAELLDLRHQIEVLVQKVAEQQAYVLIFGPLKSGKSTLMKIMAGLETEFEGRRDQPHKPGQSSHRF